MLSFLDDIFGAGKIADAVKAGEWIAAIFAGLAWAVWHPATAAWAFGGFMLIAVFRQGWPFKNVPNIDSWLGKATAITGLLLIVGGFAWRAADEVLGGRPQQTIQKTPSGQFQPVTPRKLPIIVPRSPDG